MVRAEDVEVASGTRDYPSDWGTPPGERFSEERAAWVKRHARLQQVRDLGRQSREYVDQVHDAIRRQLDDERAHETGH